MSNKRPQPPLAPRTASGRKRRAVRMAATGVTALALATVVPGLAVTGALGVALAQGTAASATTQPAGTAATPGDPTPAKDALPPVPTLVGRYDVEELRRLLEVARESGFSQEQLQEITVEDEHGNVVNAWEFIAAYDRRTKAEQERLAAERAKVYLSPKDILDELDAKQQKDLDRLRDTLIFVD